MDRTTALDLDALPPGLCTSGYRASIRLCRDQPGTIGVGVRLQLDDAVVATAWACRFPETPAGFIAARRLLTVARAMCHFCNTDTVVGRDVDTLRALVDAFAGLPAWRLAGVTLMTQHAGTDVPYDVLYDVTGRDRALRIVEDQFAEVLGPADLQAWYDGRDAEEDA